MKHDDGRKESDWELQKRIQHEMDEDSWRGLDTVGRTSGYPKRGVIHEFENEQGEVPHFWREKK